MRVYVRLLLAHQVRSQFIVIANKIGIKRNHLRIRLINVLIKMERARHRLRNEVEKMHADFGM